MCPKVAKSKEEPQEEIVVAVRFDHAGLVELQARAPQLAEQLTLAPVDQDSLDRLNDYILAAKQWVDQLHASQDPVCKATDLAHKAAVKARRELLEPVERPLKLAQQAAAQFIANAQADAKRLQLQGSVETPHGTSIRMLYSVEVVNLAEFCTYLLKDTRLLNIFSASDKIKEAIAYELGPETKLKDRYQIPGTKLVETPSGSWRG